MSTRKSFNYYLIKEVGYVWILLFLILMLIISGYGLTKPNLIHFLTGGMIDYQTALSIHTSLDAPFLILLLIHVVIGIRFSLMRWGFKNEKLLNLLTFMLVSICLILIIYIKVCRDRMVVSRITSSIYTIVSC